MENNMLVENWIPPTPHAPGCKFLVQGGHSRCVRCLENENSALRDALASLRDFVEGKRHDCESIAEILNGVSVVEHVSETYRLEGELLKAVAAVDYWIKVASDHGADIVSSAERPRPGPPPMTAESTTDANRRCLDRIVRPSRPLSQKGGIDRIYTPDDTASLIVNHFRPCGRILEPCSGGKAFVRALNGECEECEIDEGTDFMEWTDPVDWIITNPPWSKFRDFLRHGMEVSDNVVFLCPINAWFMRARQRDMQEMGFGLVEILHVPVPPPPWPQAGFLLGAGWIRRGWTGGVHFS